MYQVFNVLMESSFNVHGLHTLFDCHLYHFLCMLLECAYGQHKHKLHKSHALERCRLLHFSTLSHKATKYRIIEAAQCLQKWSTTLTKDATKRCNKMCVHMPLFTKDATKCVSTCLGPHTLAKIYGMKSILN